MRESADPVPVETSPLGARDERGPGRDVVQDSLEEAQDQVRHLLVALEHRSVTGQATGIVMERFDLTAEEAFGVLVRLSQDRNVKLYAMAERLIATGDLPGLPPRPSQVRSTTVRSPADVFPPRRARPTDPGTA